MFDPDERVPYAQIPYNVVESPEHVAQALEMAHKSMVLLKNKNNTLPLSKTIRKIAVVGPNAADSTMLWANYNGFPTHTVTILEGIRNKVPDTEVIYELGCNHAADFVIQDLGNHITSPAGQGFASEFYNNTEFKGEAVYKGLASQLHYTTGGNTQFAPNVNLTNFTARFTGEFEAPETEQVEIKLSGNDAFRLFIGDEKVAEVWENEYGAEKTYMLNAEKGKKYPVKIEYMQRTGSADLNFQIGTRRPVDYAATATKVKDADVIVYVGGISPRLEGEEMPVNVEGFKKGDRTNIEIPKVQQEMVKALKATGKPVVYVLCTGSALALNWEDANIDAILEENQQLSEENASLRSQMVDYDKLKAENEAYKALANIQEQHPEMSYTSSFVIGRDPLDSFWGFTLDRGTLDGVAVNDAVISDEGYLLGVVREADLTSCKIMTILHPSFNAAGVVSRTRDNGIITGSADYAADGLCILSNLARSTLSREGDQVITTGLGGVFPPDVLVGVIKELTPEASGKSTLAVIQPGADPRTVRHVFIITNY